MGTITHKAGRVAVGKAADVVIKNLDKDREKEILKLVDFMEKYMDGEKLDVDFDSVRKKIKDKDSALNKYINKALDEIDPNVLKTMVLNLGFEAFLNGTKTIRKMREKYNCNVPWLILMDPTSACNLHCTGCWAAEYGNRLNLTFDEMDSVVTQGKELGIYLYMFTGGEPLVRKSDIIKLCEKHNDCAFLSFTNGTLVDEVFCQEMKRVGNLYLAISLEGFEAVNDLRRGDGVYGKVMNAMDLLKKNGLVFGTSICYTSKNTETVTSDEFIQLMVDKGCRYAMYFHYMPVGNDASPELLLTPDQREEMYHAIRKFRSTKAIFTLDFQNDAEFVHGCIAGGRHYLHINANGDVEPCVFIHYSNCNIKDTSLLDALKSPIFQAYHDNQPFNKNMLRPCPMLENPEILRKLVAETGAKSTDLQSPESAEHLCGKCDKYAACWKERADQLWDERQKEKAEKARC